MNIVETHSPEAALTVRPLRPWPYHFSGKGVWSIQCPHGNCSYHSTAMACSSSSTAHSSVEDLLPEFPHQPELFPFPKKAFGKKKIVYRSCQASWFHSWSWLHYNEPKDSLFCHLCCRGIKEKKITMKPGVTDEAFVSTELIRPSPYIASYLTTFT